MQLLYTCLHDQQNKSFTAIVLWLGIMTKFDPKAQLLQVQFHSKLMLIHVNEFTQFSFKIYLLAPWNTGHAGIFHMD